MSPVIRVHIFCDTDSAVAYESAMTPSKSNRINLLRGDVERAKCKSALLHFRAEEPETGANVLRSLAQGVYSDPQGKRPVESE